MDNQTTTFLKFCYNFPYDFKDRMIKHYGESLGNHFIEKWKGYTTSKGNNFVGMIWMYMDMTTDHQETFIKLTEEYYGE
jgi:hypothetical protein